MGSASQFESQQVGIVGNATIDLRQGGGMQKRTSRHCLQPSSRHHQIRIPVVAQEPAAAPALAQQQPSWRELLAKFKAKTARAKNGNWLLTGEDIVASLETVDPLIDEDNLLGDPDPDPDDCIHVRLG